MNLHQLRADAAHSGWIRALLARMIWRLQLHLGLFLFRGNVRPFPRSPGEAAPPQGITVRVLGLQDLLEAAPDAELELDVEFIQSALARGDLACGAFDGGRLVGYSWRTASTVPFYHGLWIKTGGAFHYVYKSFTHPAYRGRRIHIAITRLADQHSLERGHAAELGFIEISNMLSFLAAKSLGRRKVGYAGYLKLFGYFITFRTAGVRKIGAELFVPAERARLEKAPGPDMPVITAS
jgi:hypothetical protein